MAAIHFSAKLTTIGSWTILHLPVSASAKLPSRGMVVVKGMLNGVPVIEPLEPDGVGSHWFRLQKPLLDKINAKSGDSVEMDMEPTKEWPEPEVPDDLAKALKEDEKARAVWESTTPIAHWDWVRSIRSTNNPATRQKRVEVAISKLRSGKKRQCCFNRSSCTDMTVCTNGRLAVTL